MTQASELPADPQADAPPVVSPDLRDELLLVDLARIPWSKVVRRPGDVTIWLLARVLRLSIPVVLQMPPVRHLAPFAVTAGELDPPAAALLAKPLAQLAACGFGEARLLRVPHEVIGGDLLFADALHADGGTVAQVSCLLLAGRPAPLVGVRFFSGAGGRVLCTASRDREPGGAEWEIASLPGAAPSALWAAHRQRLAGLTPDRIAPEDLPARSEALHGAAVSALLAAGILRPLDAHERERHRLLHDARLARQGLPHQAVLAELERQQLRKRTGLRSTLTLLGVSLLAFIAAGALGLRWQLDFLLLLLAVLIVHEAGHWLAMRAFGYRNLKVFFIPFLGAAVSGESWNVPAWKQVVVSLAGPLPGVLIGAAAAALALAVDTPAVLTQATLLLLVINGLNLLPVLPLDGGWVAHRLVFTRNPYLEAGFRLLAVVALAAGWWFLHDRVLLFLAVFLAIGLPLTWTLARITAGLRREGYAPVSRDGATIDPASALPVVDRVLAIQPGKLSVTTTAQHTLMVCRALNARPPGWLASGGLLLVHGLAIAAALGGLGLLARHERPRHAPRTEMAGLRALEPAQVRWLGSPPAGPTAPAMPAATLIATRGDARRMAAAGTDLAASLPPGTLVTLCGESLVVSLPTTDTAAAAAAMRAVLPGVELITKQSVLLIHGTITGEAGPLTLEAFSSGLETSRLIAPWDPGDPRNAGQRARDDDARAVGAALIGHLQDRYDDERLAAATEALFQAERAGDQAAAERARVQQKERIQTLFSACLDRLAGTHPLATEAIAACRTVLPQAADDDVGATLAAKLQPWLGTIDGDNPYGLAYAGGGTTGDGRRFQLVLTLHAPGIALPALVAWLHAHGVRDLRYAFMPE